MEYLKSNCILACPIKDRNIASSSFSKAGGRGGGLELSASAVPQGAADKRRQRPNRNKVRKKKEEEEKKTTTKQEGEWIHIQGIAGKENIVNSWRILIVIFAKDEWRGEFRSVGTACRSAEAEVPHQPGASPRREHTLSTAFRHLPPNSARFSYATEGALFISAQLSSDTVSALRKVRVLMWL